MRQVEFEDVTHQFPDDATDDEIKKALSSRPQGSLAAVKSTPLLFQPPTDFEIFREMVARPAGNILNAIGEAVALPFLRGDSPEAAAAGRAAGQKAGTDIARATIGSPAQAGATAATAVGGPLAGMTRVPALARVLLGSAGGEVGGQLAGEALGRGAIEGGAPTLAGEGVGKALPWLAGVLPGGKRALNAVDAARIGAAIGEISPPLAGAASTRDLRTLVEDRGLRALGDAKEQAIQRIEGMLPGTTTGPWTNQIPPGHIPIPLLGTRATPFDASKPAGMALREANDELSRIGDMLRGVRPLDPRYKDVDLKQRYADVSEAIRQGLTFASYGPEAAAAWDAAQGAYREGRSVLNYLRGSGLIDSNGMLNVPGMQRALNNVNTAAKMKKALGPDDFQTLSDAVFRGADRGAVDRVVSGGGGALDALMGLLRRQNTGFSQTYLVPIGTIFPNIGAQYAGKRPSLPMPGALQTIINIGAQRAAAGIGPARKYLGAEQPE